MCEFVKLHQAWVMILVYAAFMAAQALGFLTLGTGAAGRGFSESILVIESVIAIGCACVAIRRARDIDALFWFLFGVALLVLLVPTVLQPFDTVFHKPIVSDSTWRLLFSLYGAPILMMLFLPVDQQGRVKSEVFVDLFQIAIVVTLVYSTFFFLPARQMLPADALLHDISITNAHSLFLLAAALVRLHFTRAPATRNRLLRLAVFLTVCAVATVIGDWIDLHHYVLASVWFDLGWAIPELAAALVAITWTPSSEPECISQPKSFVGFVGTNLALVAMLSGIHLLMDHWRQAVGETLSHVAIIALLLAFTLRLALTQFHQHEEIIRRKMAQMQLTASNQKVCLLLDDARRQTSEITQISEIGSLLQACSSREEVFRLIPERLRRLFPGASGCISLLSESKNRAESVAEWGICPRDQIFVPDDCWALRRGRAHVHPGGTSGPRCAHLIGEGPSVCIPLIANRETIGILSIQNDERPPAAPNPDSDANGDTFAGRGQLAAAVAEHIAVSVANLGLRESLRLQAVRDPVTGLYNRRYMQEFLDRELLCARRKHRPIAVMMIDLDHFKRYNDNFGHSAGDGALAAVGEVLLRSVRAEDIACRYGGEEFALILPECSLLQATVRAEEIRKRVRECRAQRQQQSIGVLTVSIGVAAFDETTDTVNLLLKFADDALYEAKRAGRDRVVAAQPAAPLPESAVTETEQAAIATTGKS